MVIHAYIPDLDQRTHNAPTASQVAAIWINDDIRQNVVQKCDIEWAPNQIPYRDIFSVPEMMDIDISPNDEDKHNVEHEHGNTGIQHRKFNQDKIQSNLYQGLQDAALHGDNNPQHIEDLVKANTLNEAQHAVFDEIQNLINQSNNRIAFAVASSGITSLLLHDGCTAHSHFKVPIPINENATCNIKKCTDLAKLLQETILVIWDEAPMTRHHILETVDRTLRDIMENDLPFGASHICGIMFVFSL
nr:4911_t:CDS:2 [Entrophospora candida]